MRSKDANAESWSAVEAACLKRSNSEYAVPASEHTPTIVVENFFELGKLVALRFLEWVIENPEGVVSLPTGKTPEYFIQWVTFLLSNWKEKSAQDTLRAHGITAAAPPSLRGLRFVQIDEFYPINTDQKNSFYYYVRAFYFKGFGLDIKKALLINPNEIGLKRGERLEEVWPQYRVDLSLRERQPHSIVEARQQRQLMAVDQFCDDYERRIRDWGGIGFFLGGIGPDGHIGFNVRGSMHHSTTRLCATNYETQAAAAIDLGGIEVTRTRLVITIGLATITHNPQCTAIVMVAGEAKARIVRDAICSPASIAIPASALRSCPHARFYITAGAAKHLEERNYIRRKNNASQLKSDEMRIVTELALLCKKEIATLTKQDFSRTDSARLLAERRTDTLRSLIEEVATIYRKRITDSLTVPTGKVFLHTAPHHDDIMLGYIPYLARLIRDQSNKHYFNYLTSGFTAVTNQNLIRHIDVSRHFIDTSDEFSELERVQYFQFRNQAFRDRDVLVHLDGVASGDSEQANFGTARRFLRTMNELYDISTKEEFRTRLTAIKSYLATAYPGMKDDPEIQRLKGATREWEADLLWGFFGFNSNSISHSRLGFYKGDIFTEQPQHERDMMPIVETLRTLRPNIISVALDPEGSGPDTHYKVLHAISGALKQYQKESGHDDIEVWGYRNVWYRYQPFEANWFIPVSLMSMAVMQQTFIKSFLSQATASFPSHEFDGTFSALAQKVQVEQYRQLLTLLGREFFYQNPDSRIRSTRGFVFLKKMRLNEFYDYTREAQGNTSPM